MRGKLRESTRKNGRSVLFIDYYPPVSNPQTQKFIWQENLKLYVYDKPANAFEKSKNAVSREIAEEIYLKRMKALMLEEHKLFNHDVHERDFYSFARNFIIGKEKAKKGLTRIKKVLPFFITRENDRRILSASLNSDYTIRDKYLHNNQRLTLDKIELTLLLDFERIIILRLIDLHQRITKLEDLDQLISAA